MVPVDQRWLGMDRRGIPYALVALGLIVVLTRVVPAIDGAIEWDNPARAGDVVDLGFGIRITPPTGWQIEDGILAGQATFPVSAKSATAQFADGTTQITVRNGGWSGSANELLDQSDRISAVSGLAEDKAFTVTGPRTTFTTTSGIVGVAEPFSSPAGDGTIYGFVVEDAAGESIGVVVSVTDASDTPNGDAQQATDSVSSLTVDREAS
jgi:hypothetical protein